MLTSRFTTKIGRKAQGVCLGIAVLALAAQARELANQIAPDFPSPAGVWVNSPPVSFLTLEGKVILIAFCDLAGPDSPGLADTLKMWHKRYAGQGLVIIGVHSSPAASKVDAASVRRAVHRQGIVFPVAVDSDLRIANSYGIYSIPYLFLINPERRILFRHNGGSLNARFEQQIQLALQAAAPRPPHPAGLQ